MRRPRFATTAALLALATAVAGTGTGCATGLTGIGGDSLARAPSATYRSGKRPAEVARCIVERWKVTKVKGTKPTGSMQREGDTFRAELRLDNNLDQVVLIDVDNSGSGSISRRWTLGRYFGDTPVQVVDIEACQ
jgi:hypothetical protein